VIYVVLCFSLYLYLLVIVCPVPYCFLLCHRVNFYSCFFVQFLFALYVSLCVGFNVALDGLRWFFNIILISYCWFIKDSCIQQYILVSVKFCASSCGCTLESL
jgi:hypothetical protein